MQPPENFIPTRCNICGAQYVLAYHLLHLVARHWNWLEALHNKTDLLETADKKHV